MTVFLLLCVSAYHEVLFFITNTYLCQNESKRKMDLECHVFRAQWSVDYFVTQLNDEAIFNFFKKLPKEPINFTRLSSCHNIPNS